MNSLNSKNFKLAVLAAFSFIGMFFIALTPSVYAGYTDLPAQLPEKPSELHTYINITNTDSGNTSVEGEPYQGAGLRASYIKVYSPEQKNIKVGIHITDRGLPYNQACTGYTIRITSTSFNNQEVFDIDPRDTPGSNDTSSAKGLQPNGCSGMDKGNGNDGFYYFTIPAAGFSQNSAPGHTYKNFPLWEATVQFFITDPAKGQHSAAFRAFTDGSGRLGFPADPYYTNYGDPVGGDTTRGVVIYPSALASENTPPNCDPGGANCVTPKDHFIRSKICNPTDASVTATINWQDDNRGQANKQSTAFSAEVREYSKDGSYVSTLPTPGAGNPSYGNGSGYGAITVTLKPKVKYQLWFRNVWGGNGIKIFYPNESGDYNLACDQPTTTPTPPTATCTSSTVKDDGEYDPPGGLNQAYSTNTYVDIVDSSGTVLVDSKLPTADPRSGHLGKNEKETWNYTPYGQDVTIKIVRKYNNTSIAGGKWVTYSDTSNTYRCYSGSCTIYFNSNVPGRASGLQGGSNLNSYAIAVVTNTGTMPWPATLAGTPLMFYSAFDGKNPQQQYSGTVSSGASVSLYLDPYNQGIGRGIKTISLGGRMAYPGRIDPLAACNAVTVNMYEQFDIVPIAMKPTLDTEDPRAVEYKVGGNNRLGYPAPINWQSKLYRERGNVTLDGIFNDNDRFGNILVDRRYDPGRPLVPTDLEPGDKVCSWSKVSITDGLVGPGDDVVQTAPSKPAATSCETIYNKPYLRAYGADVTAGGGFAADGCPSISGAGAGILGYRSAYNDRGGSGAQFAALAQGSIDGFMTASLRTSIPKWYNGLTIANTPSLGGYTGAICATDFFNDKKYPEDNSKRIDKGTTSLNIKDNELDDGKQTVFNDANRPGYNTNYKLDINGPAATTLINNRHSVFVDGDVVIKNNIKLRDNFTDPLAAPAFMLVVRGNIYIDKDVDRLDGMYVAQGRPGGGGGTIYTCTNDDTPYDPNGGNDAAMLAACSKQLKVNGMFVSNDVKFLRTIYSLRDSFIDERSETPCTPSVRNKSNSCAAEVFNYTPEIFLSPPPSYSAPPSLDFQSYETLPPIL